jgi:hypothetical protein
MTGSSAAHSARRRYLAEPQQSQVTTCFWDFSFVSETTCIVQFLRTQSALLKVSLQEISHGTQNCRALTVFDHSPSRRR